MGISTSICAETAGKSRSRKRRARGAVFSVGREGFRASMQCAKLAQPALLSLPKRRAALASADCEKWAPSLA